MRSCYQAFVGTLSDATCDSIIEHAQRLPSQDATVRQERTLDPEQRRSKVTFLPTHLPDFHDLYDFVMWHVKSSNRNHFGLAVDGFDAFQFTQYDESDQGHYGIHMDSFLEYDGWQRKLSVTIQLSHPEDYDGGDFELTCPFGVPPDPKTLRVRGTVLIFPSFLYHLVTPVTRGTRYSLVCWVMGPPFT